MEAGRSCARKKAVARQPSFQNFPFANAAPSAAAMREKFLQLIGGVYPNKEKVSSIPAGAGFCPSTLQVDLARALPGVAMGNAFVSLMSNMAASWVGNRPGTSHLSTCLVTGVRLFGLAHFLLLYVLGLGFGGVFRFVPKTASEDDKMHGLWVHFAHFLGHGKEFSGWYLLSGTELATSAALRRVRWCGRFSCFVSGRADWHSADAGGLALGRFFVASIALPLQEVRFANLVLA